MLRVVTMTAYRRPAYTRQVLAALARCDGIADWILLPNAEPGNEEVISAFQAWDVCESRLVVNRRRLGLNRNTHKAVLRAIELRADTIVHLEDDTVPSTDALRYFDWAVRDALSRDKRHTLLFASGYCKPCREPGPEQSHTCGVRPVWTPWGWAVDLPRLKWLVSHWCFKNPKCFTCHIKATYRRTRSELFPHLSRIQNIGYEAGENGRTPEWYRKNHRTPWVAGELTPAPFSMEVP